MSNVFKNARARAKVLASYEEVLQLWGTRVEAHDVPTRYGSTHCLTAGEAGQPPLLLFHGVGDNSALMWALNMKELSRHFYCIAIDTLGGPGRSIPNQNYTKKTFDRVEWINGLASHFGLATMHLAGVSNGAHIAYHYTTACPERVGRAVCLEGGIVTSPLKAMARTLMLMFPEILMPTDRNMHKVIRKLCSPSSNVFDDYPLLVDHLVLLMKSHNQGAMFPHRPQLYNKPMGAAVRDKLYFLLGDHHSVVEKGYSDFLGREGFRYRVIPGAGHAINHEQPDLVNQEIIAFLQGALG